MADRFLARCLQTTLAGGVGGLELAPSPDGYEDALDAGASESDGSFYFITGKRGTVDQHRWEFVYSTVTAGVGDDGDTLNREACLKSSDGVGSAINWTPGVEKLVYSTPDPTILSSILRNHAGTSRPGWLPAGGKWIDTSADPIWVLRLYDGTNDIALGRLDTENGLALDKVPVPDDPDDDGLALIASGGASAWGQLDTAGIADEAISAAKLKGSSAAAIRDKIGLGNVTNAAQLPLAGGTMAGFIVLHSDPTQPMHPVTLQYLQAFLEAQDVFVLKGGLDCSGDPNYPAANAGHVYKVSVAGKIGGAAGVDVEVGDTLYCITDSTAAGNHATVGANWIIAQTNLNGDVLLKSNATATLTAGFSATAYDAGTKSSGTFTPDPADGNLQKAVNGGAHTLAPPASDTVILVQYTNNGSAGAITASGFDKVVGGDDLTTVDGDDFFALIERVNGFSRLTIGALQ